MRRLGCTRIRRGRGFRYLDSAGEPLTDPGQLARIRALTIPPAWRDVWICPWPNGHLQAVGTDDAGRRQYLYHERFRAEQDKAEHEHVRQVARALPELRAKVALDPAGRGLSRDRVAACAVRLLDLSWHDLHSDDLNETPRRLSGTDVTAKDFRTWHATVPAAVAVSVAARDARATEAARRRQIARAVREVSHYLGNTPAVCRTSYIDPKVFELFEQGVTVEAAVLDLLDGSGG
ncbi:hypothetical protein AB0L14_30895 [Streptomyces sp. NPDC052727]|uniref:hypothetical protein n=1 Tax=Streptomyces sp. NPDC052727 TaxID=3154854 RepID=UPI003435CA3E